VALEHIRRGIVRLRRATPFVVCATMLVLPPSRAAEANLRTVSIVTLEGRSLPFGSVLQPHRAHVLLFWSLYQPESRRALKAFDRLTRDLAEHGAATLTVALPEYKESPGAVTEFLSRAHVGTRTIMDPSGELFRALTRPGRREARLPTAVLLREDGTAGGVVEGWSDEWAESILALVERPGKSRP